LERAVVLALWITCTVVLPALALAFYVVSRSKPGRFKLTATLAKIVSINIEVDAEDKAKELPAASESATDSGSSRPVGP
jgi:hypothetical protein